MAVCVAVAAAFVVFAVVTGLAGAAAAATDGPVRSPASKVNVAIAAVRRIRRTSP